MARPAETLRRSGGGRRPLAFRRGQALCTAFAASLGVLAACAAPAAQRVLPESSEQIQLSFAPVVRIAAPAVVNIYSRRVVTTAGSPLFNDPFFRRFFGESFSFGAPRQRVQNSLGSGVIASPDGTIVTNHHVVGDADEITVILADKREFAAKLLGSDEHSDLAVLKVDTGGESLPYIEFRDSDTVRVGDLVLAIGNPFGVGQTVTSGIVSAQARTAVGISDLNFFIQTDAAINPGNSGGALIDMGGRLIGINTAIYSQSGGSIGIGFAVPSNMVHSVVASFSGGGRRLQRPWLGAWGSAVTSDVAQALGLRRPTGVLIEEVAGGGPAERAGIRVGDVILAVNDQPVDDPQALLYRIATLGTTSSAEVELWRKGEDRRVTLPVRGAPEDPPRDPVELEGVQPLAGATVANLSPALADELGTDRYYRGVVVIAVEQGSNADQIGLQRGDRILSVNGEDVASSSGLRRQVGRRVQRWQIVVGRGEQRFNLVFGG
ncbi:MAG: DegQ family serine endoprotease [Rhodospirillales bacterium]